MLVKHMPAILCIGLIQTAFNDTINFYIMTNTKLDNATALNGLSTIDIADIEQLLTYHIVDDRLACNLNIGLAIEADDDAFETFHLATSMFWPQISMLIYGTTSLYWLLQRLNPELTTSPFNKVIAPNHIRYLPNAEAIVSMQQY